MIGILDIKILDIRILNLGIVLTRLPKYVIFHSGFLDFCPIRFGP